MRGESALAILAGLRACRGVHVKATDPPAGEGVICDLVSVTIYVNIFRCYVVE